MNYLDILAYIKPDKKIFTEEAKQLESTIEKLGEKLSSFANPDFEKLTRARILASNTHLKEQSSLQKWDAANATLAEFISQESPLLEIFQGINQSLTDSQSELRDHRIFTCDEEYLEPEHVPAAVETLKGYSEGFLKNSPLAFGFYLYLWGVTVHPFENGNGRTARLLGDYKLIQNGFLPMCFQSPVYSHVAITYNGRHRNIEGSYLKFLGAVINSYEIVMGKA